MYGYDENGSIIADEAEVIRRIYRKYLEGYSVGMIADHLTDQNVPSPRGKEKWYQSSVRTLLGNEKYCGDFLMQKYFVKDFLTHKTARNTGQLPQYFVEGDHDPIVPKEIYYQVQGEKLRRGSLMRDPAKLRFGSSIALSGRLFCGICGRTLKRYMDADPEKIDWRCRNRGYVKSATFQERKPDCACRNVKETEVKVAVVEAFNRLPEMRDTLLRQIGALRDGSIDGLDHRIEAAGEQIERLEERMNGLDEGEEKTFLNGEIEKLEAEKTKLILERADIANRELHTRLFLELADLMVSSQTTCAEETGGEVPCSDYDDFFHRTRYTPPKEFIDADGKITAFSDNMVIRYLDSITVNDDGYEVKFKAGVSVNVKTA